MSTKLTDIGVDLSADPKRVVARLFMPGEATPGSSSRTQGVLDRTLALPAEEVSRLAASTLARFGDRHTGLARILRGHALSVRPSLPADLDHDLGIAIGAAFTAEIAVEGAAICNPSVVTHPDQTGLEPGQLRVAVSLRSIGEGHISSIGFCEAIIGPGPSWEFLPRDRPLALAAISPGQWTRKHLIRALEHRGHTAELARTVAQSLPKSFGSDAVERAVQALSTEQLRQPDARAQQETIRVVAGSAYQASFAETSSLSQRVLQPVADEESHGLEDLRITEFTAADGHTDYRGTYTAYDGHSIATRTISTTDLRTFKVERITGPPTRAKGMALFPRTVNGRFLALARGDGETTSLTSSADGLDWAREVPLHRPARSWEIVQTGNCGSPIETAAGWLVLTHGVGPMRVYSISAILLDLDDPSRVIATLNEPLLEPSTDSDGYVPNVVYSCGGVVHEDVLWVPFGAADQHIRVAWISLPELLAQLLTAANEQ
jgi:predicted GH43/DUF377 family glycosyl hydrolase